MKTFIFVPLLLLSVTVVDVPVTMSLEEDLSIQITPPQDLGAISIGDGPKKITLIAQAGNVPCALLAKVVVDTGWSIADEPGTDTFAVFWDQGRLSEEYVTIKTLAAYEVSPLELIFLGPTSDTQGGGVDHGWSLSFKVDSI